MCWIGDVLKYLINFQPIPVNEKFTVRKFDNFGTCNVNWFSMFGAINSSEHPLKLSAVLMNGVKSLHCTSTNVPSSWMIDNQHYEVWNETVLSTTSSTSSVVVWLEERYCNSLYNSISFSFHSKPVFSREFRVLLQFLNFSPLLLLLSSFSSSLRFFPNVNITFSHNIQNQ